MASLKLDKEKFEESYGVLLKLANSDVIEHMQNLADVLKSEAEEGNETLSELLTQCKAAQSMYNDEYKPLVEGTLKDFSELEAIADFLASAQAIDTIKVDSIDYKDSGIDSSTIM